MKRKKVWVPMLLGVLCLLAIAGGVLVNGRGGEDMTQALSDTRAVQESSGGGMSSGDGGAASKAMPAAESMPAAEVAAADSDGGVEAGRSVEAVLDLKAGEIDDNERWRDYLEYRESSSVTAREAPVAARRVITVVDGDGNPVLGAEVAVMVSGETESESRTYADGRTLWMPAAMEEVDAADVEVSATKGGLSGSVQASGDESELEIRLEGVWEPPQEVELDVAYLVDATGSMADEIARLKETLVNVVGRIEGGNVPVDLRMGMVAYRDRGDDFVVRSYDLDGDIEALRDEVRGLEAEGGGDRLESVNEGLHAPVSQLEWRGDDAVKVVFLVGDAGPHLDYEQDRDYAVEMRKALARGIKVHTVATSGLRGFGEYVFRQIAQHTMGKFVFLVYGGSTTHAVGQFTEENLDDLIVDLVLEEVGHLAR